MTKLIKGILLFSLVTGLTGCSTIEKILNPDQEKQDQFNYMNASLLENSSFRSNATYYDLDVEVVNNGSSYDYTVTLSNPKKALLNVGIMVMDSLGQQGNQDHIHTVGVMDQVIDLIPNQVYYDENLYDVLTVTGSFTTIPDSLKILVTWNDDQYTNYISDFYYVDIQEELTVHF